LDIITTNFNNEDYIFGRNTYSKYLYKFINSLNINKNYVISDGKFIKDYTYDKIFITLHSTSTLLFDGRTRVD
jgi:hypothetical protein